MELFAVCLVIFSALLHASWNFLNKQSKNAVLFSGFRVLFIPILFSPLMIYFLFVETVPLVGWLFILLSGFFSSMYSYFLGKAYANGDLSITYPVARSSTIFVPFLAFFLIDEKLSALGIAGIIIILVGMFLLHCKSLKLKAILHPFSHLKEKATLFALLTALFSSFYSITDKVAVGYVHPFLYFCLVSVVASFFYVPILFSKANRKKTKKEWSENKKSILLASVLDLCSYVLILFTFQIAKVSYVVSLRQLSIVFGVLLGAFILGERYKSIRIVASVVMFVGFILVALA